MPNFLGGIRATLIPAAVAGLAFVLLFVAFQRLRTAGAEAALSRNVGGAAIASGQDASNTVGAVGASAAAYDQTGRTNDAEIRKADGAGQSVAAGVDRAGRNALCLRAAYRRDPRCLRQPAP